MVEGEWICNGLDARSFLSSSVGALWFALNSLRKGLWNLKNLNNWLAWSGPVRLPTWNGRFSQFQTSSPQNGLVKCPSQLSSCIWNPPLSVLFFLIMILHWFSCYSPYRHFLTRRSYVVETQTGERGVGQHQCTQKLNVLGMQQQRPAEKGTAEVDDHKSMDEVFPGPWQVIPNSSVLSEIGCNEYRWITCSSSSKMRPDSFEIIEMFFIDRCIKIKVYWKSEGESSAMPNWVEMKRVHLKHQTIRSRIKIIFWHKRYSSIAILRFLIVILCHITTDIYRDLPSDSMVTRKI